MELSLNEAILRLFMALALGTVVGLERELSHQTAGLRTHILVCLGATVYTIVSISDLFHGMTAQNGVNPNSIIQDPSRIAAQIVSGIGFIGGGAVLRHGTSIRGLTTAASLWMMASIGMLVGIGHYYLSTVATFFAFLVLFTIGSLERNLFNKHQKNFSKMRIQVTSNVQKSDQVFQWLENRFNQDIIEHKSTKEGEEGDHQLVSLSCVVNINGLRADVNKLSRQLNELPGVVSSSCKVFQEESAT